jgi:hypothetical protein
MSDKKTVRDLFREAYKADEKQEQTQKDIELKEADVDKASAHRLLSWGYKKLLDEANNVDE